MKYLLFLLLITLLTTATHGQTTERQVISSSGNTFNNGTNEISFTVGETIVATHSQSIGTLTQGFHQTKLEVFFISERNKKYLLDVFPNPTIATITIRSEFTGENLEAKLFATDGSIVHTSTFYAGEEKSLDMSGFAPGTYQLIILNKNQNIETFSIVKSN